MPPKPKNSRDSCGATGPGKLIGRENIIEIPRNGGSMTVLRNLTSFSRNVGETVIFFMVAKRPKYCKSI